MQLPDKKLKPILSTIKITMRSKHASFKELEHLRSKLYHISLAIPWAKGLFHLIIKALMEKKKYYCLSKGTPLAKELLNFATMTSLLVKEPTLAC